MEVFHRIITLEKHNLTDHLVEHFYFTREKLKPPKLDDFSKIIGKVTLSLYILGTPQNIQAINTINLFFFLWCLYDLNFL